MAITTQDRRAEFIEQARTHLGYHCKPGNVSYYGGLVGYQGLPWDGSFVDVVAHEASLTIPSCAYPPSGLAEFINQRRWHAKPQPGDIVFFAWSTGEKFGSPHVGIVTDVTGWNTNGKFLTIEAQVNSGLPKAQELADGVFERVRYKHDVLGFGRPNFGQRPGREPKNADGRKIKAEQVRPGRKPNPYIERVQLALSVTCGLRNATRGMWDGQTRAAYARWQRSIGYVGVDASGLADNPSLAKLGEATGYFESGVVQTFPE